MIPYKEILVFRIGGFATSTWFAMVSIAFIVGTILAIKEAKRRKVDYKQILFMLGFMRSRLAI